MTNEHTRRDLLRSAGVASASFAVLPIETSAEASVSETVETEEIPYDVSIINNSDEKKPVLLTIQSAESGERLFERRYSLQGLNNPAKRADEQVKFKGRVEATGRGEYTVKASLPGGSSDTTTVTVTEDGVVPDQAVNVYVRTSEIVTADTVM